MQVPRLARPRDFVGFARDGRLENPASMQCGTCLVHAFRESAGGNQIEAELNKMWPNAAETRKENHMRKKLLCALMSVGLCAMLVPATALAESFSGGGTPAVSLFEVNGQLGGTAVSALGADQGFAAQPIAEKASSVLNCEIEGPCEQANEEMFDIGSMLPNGACVTAINLTTPTILNGANQTYSSGIPNYAYISVTTRIFDEPRAETLTSYATVKTKSDGIFTVNLKVTLTGKYIVNIDAQPHSVPYDGETHSGFEGLSTSLTDVGKGAYPQGYQGNLVYSYAKADGTVLPAEPSEVGDYTVTIAVPDDNVNFKGSTTLRFSIFAEDEAEAEYQAAPNGQWIKSSFDEAVASVYKGGTIKLLTDVTLTTYVTLDKPVTVTSKDAAHPKAIKMTHDSHGCLMNVTGQDIVLKDVVLDGGSAEGIESVRAAIIVSGGKLTLGDGAIVRNNKSVSEYLCGGGVRVSSGSLVLDGGVITGNVSSYKKAGGGGGVYVYSGSFTMKRGSIEGNVSLNNGGGLYVYKGTASISGGTISGNSASNVGGAVMADVHATLNLGGGKIVGNSAENFAGGIECSPLSSVNVSGDPVVAGNASPEEVDGGLYIDGASSYGWPNVAIGQLSDDANVHFYTWAEEDGFLIASSADGYAITQGDMDKMTYVGGNYYLKLVDKGSDSKAVAGNQVVLASANHFVEAAAGEGGSVSPLGKIGVCEGSSLTFSVVPDEGFEIDDVLVDGVSVGAVASYVFEDIQGNHVMSATFKEKELPDNGDGLQPGDDGDGSGDAGAGGAPDDEADDGANGAGNQPSSGDSPQSLSSGDGGSKAVAVTGDAAGTKFSTAVLAAGVGALALAACAVARRRVE